METNTNLLYSEKVKKAILATLICLAVFIGAKTLTEFLNYKNISASYNSITVEGKGEAVALSDIAKFSFSIDEEATTLPEAQKKATEINNKIVKYLKDKGIADKDVKTISYNAGPKYTYPPCNYNGECGKSVISGYTISNSIEVKVREADKAGELVSGIGEMGASTISSLEFVVDDEDALKAEARRLAIEDAKNKAKILAKDLGVSLVEMTGFVENAGGCYGGCPMTDSYASGSAMKAEASVPELPRGENKLITHVSITYTIRSK